MKTNRASTSYHGSAKPEPWQNLDRNKAKNRETLRGSRERFAKIFSESPAAMIVSNTDGEIVFANRRVHSLLGYADDELIGRSIEQLVPEDNRRAHVQSRAAFNRRPSERPMRGRNLMARRKDGSRFPVEIGLVPLQFDDEAFIITSLVDRTERSQIEEEAYRRANEIALLYRLSMALAGGANLNHALRAFVGELRQMMSVDAFHTGLYDPQTKLLTYSLFLNLDQDLQPPPRNLGEQPGLSWEVVSKKKTIYIEDVADPKLRGAYQYVVVVDLPIRSYLGIPLLLHDRVIGIMSVQSVQPGAYTQNQIQLLETIAAQVVVTIERTRLLQQLQQELAERRLLNEELESKNAELERFAYTVSHDLKSPLVTINGFLGFLEQSASAGNMDRFRRDKKRIEDAVNRMQNLLKELLEFSRIGRMMNEPVNIPFADIVQEALELVHGQLEKRRITIHTQPSLPAVRGDRQRLVEVLQNLIDNAAKYMGAQPEPIIEIGQRGEEHGKPVFFVKDNGMGIPLEFQERVFGLFNKLDPQSEGSGVGLALVKRIVEIHSGQIWIESEVGQGTTFYFTLPRAPQ